MKTIQTLVIAKFLVFSVLKISFASSDILCKVVLTNENIIRIDKGSFSGITSDLSGIVKRNGEYIALIKLISVQENTSVAKLIEKSADILIDDEVILGLGKDEEWKNAKIEKKVNSLKREASIYYRQKKYNKAFQLYSKIIKLSPNENIASQIN